MSDFVSPLALGFETMAVTLSVTDPQYPFARHVPIPLTSVYRIKSLHLLFCTLNREEGI